MPRSSKQDAKVTHTRKRPKGSASPPTQPGSGANDSTGEVSGASCQQSTAVAERVERLPTTKLDEGRIERICTALREGQSRRCSARLAGIAESTLFGWLAKGREAPDSLEGDLLRRAAEAEAQCEAEHVGNVRRAAMEDKQWTASAWWLERRDPEAWARKSRVQVEHSVTPPADPSLGGRSMLMQQVIFNLGANSDPASWPEPMREAFDALTGKPSGPGKTIDGEAEQADAPVPAPAAPGTGDLF